MRWLLVSLVLMLATLPLLTMADSGRAAPNCVTRSIDDLAASVTVDPGVCILVDLGVLTPNDVHEVEAVVVDDAVDMLFFDENSVQPYELGQSYRSNTVETISTESALGGYEFHWKTPPSITAKRWYVALDNTAHDGDNGSGDQGGLPSQVSFSMTKLTEAYWTLYHDVVAMNVNDSSVLLSGDDLRLDAGTTVVISAWDLESVGDVYLQTRDMHDRYNSGAVGVQYIDGGSIQGVTSPQSVTWQVPSTLDGEELLLVADNTNTPLGGGDGSAPLRLTVRIELAPPLTPTVTDDNMGSISLGEALTLDATSTPNRLGQQGQFSWDTDALVDSNADGNPTNDGDLTGPTVEAMWTVPGEKTITVLNTAPSGDLASTEYTVTVVDSVDPSPVITGNTTPIAGGWKVNVGTSIALSCASSTDDHQVANCLWRIEGQEESNQSSVTLTPDRVGAYDVMLTVSDASGNEANVSAVVRSVDPTLPSIAPDSVVNFPTEIEQDGTLSFDVSVSDEYDNNSDLRVHWDLNPGVDSDGNGEPTDDPDRVGLNPSVTFSTSGETDIVVTVFDASNNSRSYAFTVDVAPKEPQALPFGQAFIAVLVVVGLLGGAAVGYRTVQRRNGLALLMENGLSKEEAQGHMAIVAQRRRLSFRAKPEEHAGLDQGEVRPQAERQQAAKEAEMQAIYGSTPEVDQHQAFAPPPQQRAPTMSAASAQMANEAASMLMDESDATDSTAVGSDALSAFYDDEPVAAEPTSSAEEKPLAGVDQSQTAAGVVHGGVSLPEGMTGPTAKATPPPVAPAPPAATNVRHTCDSCGAVFEVDVPAGLSEALVACPSCDSDQHVVAGE